MTWNQLANRTWESFYGDYVYVWKNGEWKFLKNTAVATWWDVYTEQYAHSKSNSVIVPLAKDHGE